MSSKIFRTALFICFALTTLSCDRTNRDPEKPDRLEDVLIIYSAGRNDLTFSLQQDIIDLTKGYVPKKNADKALVIVGHHSAKSSSFATPAIPYVIQMYRDKNNEVILDTLKAFPEDMMLTKAEDMSTILSYVRDNFKSDNYGMIFSSHGTGWLPKGYYTDPSKYERVYSNASKADYCSSPARQTLSSDGGMIIDESELPDGPSFTKSAGCEYHQQDGETRRYELDIVEFCSSLPMNMRYLIFDACLMGCIEMAYELRSKCNYIVFSQAEVLSDGFDYLNIGSRLLEDDQPDLKQVCQDFFNLYKDRSGSSCTATISLIDCNQLDALADCCNALFETHREEISNLSPLEVQPFSRPSKNWFFDLKDILDKSGLSSAERSELYGSLDECVLFKLTTKRILNMYDVNSFCGLTMFLPSSGGQYLLDFYKTLTWNSVTNLVK